MSAERTAGCACGELVLKIEGDPVAVFSCHCGQCQKRTGSAFGVSAYFAKEQIVSIEGAHQPFARPSESGRRMEFQFCPRCASTVFWSLDQFPDHYGVAAGCLDSDKGVEPTFACWTGAKQSWVTFPPGFPQSAAGDDPRA